MLKRDILKIFTASEVSRIIGKDRSQVTRMPKVVPEKYHDPLIAAARKKVLQVNRALERIKEN